MIYGGACASPVVTDADVYVGLDYGFSSFRSPKAYPWEEGESFLYLITDMCAPSNPESFEKLIFWLAEKLQEGKKVHVGCIGGHGRTGTVLAALVKHMTGEKDAITYVRKHYCDRAVESRAQVDFLAKHWGVTPVAGYKEFKKEHKHSLFNGPPVPYFENRTRPKAKPRAPKAEVKIMPCKNAVLVFGPSVSFDN